MRNLLTKLPPPDRSTSAAARPGAPVRYRRTRPSGQPPNRPQQQCRRSAYEQEFRRKQVGPELRARTRDRYGEGEREHDRPQLHGPAPQRLVASAFAPDHLRLGLQLARRQPPHETGGAQRAVANDVSAGNGPAEYRVVGKQRPPRVPAQVTVADRLEMSAQVERRGEARNESVNGDGRADVLDHVALGPDPRAAREPEHVEHYEREVLG